jgi:hypothetical protein
MAASRSYLSWFEVPIVAAAILYLASYGPANSLVRSGVVSARRVDAFYELIPEKVRYDVILAVWTRIDTREGVGERP